MSPATGSGPAPQAAAASAPPAPRGVRRARAVLGAVAAPVLRVRLAGKLAGANALVALAALGAAAVAAPTAPAGALAWVVAALAAALALSVALVTVALRPLHALEDTAARVWRGDVEARVPASPLADPAVARVGHALNAMLDGVARDRARLRALTADAIRAGHDERDERLELERALRDSAAQTLAASVYQLAAARHVLEPRLAAAADDAAAAEAAAALALAHRLAAEALDEVRQLAAGPARRAPTPQPPDDGADSA